MIEAKEIKTEKEQPTDTDVRLLFGDLQKPMEALQKIFVGALEKLTNDNVDTKRASIEIEDGTIIVRLGEYVLYHRVTDNIYFVGEK